MAVERRVLIVDDDAVCLGMLTRALRRRGYEVAPFADPREALQSLAAEAPAAVVTDMRMPHLSGLDVVRAVRDRLGEAGPPVIVVSADGDEHLLEEAFRLGAADYLLKPVSEVELGVKLERALRSRPAPPGADSLPRRLGRYELLECIGRGGTACVFRARRDGEPEAAHALKAMWPHLVGSKESMLRFRREIDTLSGLDHPGLVRFGESGREGDCFYYVMELLEGGSLRDRIAEGPLPPEEVLDLLAQLAAPLDYLHARGLVHRDVKPSNLFLTPRGLVLGDLGLARRLLDHGITLTEEFIGTPLYLAPEVFRTADFDASVDFYSAGVCAYEMLLGRPPLDQKDSMRVIARILEAGLPDPRDLLPGLSPALVEVLARLTAYLPQDRVRSGAELRELVERARAG